MRKHEPRQGFEGAGRGSYVPLYNEHHGNDRTEGRPSNAQSGGRFP
jgi:hypothetical protein